MLRLGGGKSLAAAVIALKKMLPTIVIAPKHLCGQWREELLAQGVANEDIFVYNQTARTKEGEAYMKKFLEWLHG